jgi:putative membrane protein
MSRRPTSFNLDEVRFEPDELYPDAGEETADAVAAVPRPRGRVWLGVFFGAVALLVLAAIGIGVDNLVRALFDRSDALGWLGAAIAALAVVALLVIIARETIGLLRLRRIHVIHARAVEAAATDDRDRALVVVREIDSLYRRRPETARARSYLASHRNEIIDGRDLIGLAETNLLLPFDESARRMVLGSAKRVALVTAISPRALVDLLFVGAEILRLIRRMAILYGGRPGALGFFRLARETISHLALTGGIAAGDSLIQQIIGHGVAARLSARLGEGVINGLLTARVGIAAIEVCRPLPFINGSPPRIADVMAALRPLSKDKDE